MNGKEVSLLAYMCSHCVMPTDFNEFRRLVHKFTEEPQSEAFSECVTVLRQVVTKYVAEIDQAKRTDLLIEESISLMKSSHVPSKAVGEALIWAINCRKSAEARAQTPENQIRELKKEVKALRDELERLCEALRDAEYDFQRIHDANWNEHQMRFMARAGASKARAALKVGTS